MIERNQNISFEGLLWLVFEICSLTLSVLWTAGFLVASGAAVVVSALLTVVWEAGKYLLTTEVSRGVAAGPALVVRGAWVVCLASMAVLAGVLVVGSGAYTVGGVLVGAAAEAEALAETAQGQSARIPALEAEALALVEDVSRTQAEIVEFNRRRWPNNAAAARERLEEYKARQREIAGELDQLRGVDRDREIAGSGASPRFAVLAGAVGVEAQWLEQAWAIGVGVLIEGLNLVLISRRHLLAGLKRLQKPTSEARGSIFNHHPTPDGWEDEKTQQEDTPWLPPIDDPKTDHGGLRYAPRSAPEPVERSQNPDLQRREQVILTPHAPAAPTTATRRSVVWSVEIEDRYRDLVEALKAGEVEPSTREIRAYCHCGGAVAGQIQLRLVEDQICEREGRGLRVRPEVLRGSLHSVGGGQ